MGGNIDGVLFDKDYNICAIIENRRSWRSPIDKYDPNRYFFGTQKKSGDYMTWLPLVYASKMLDVPLMLFTFSKYNPKSFGVAVIETMGKNYGLNYKENPPNKNIFRNIDNFKRWLRKNMNIEV